MFRADRAHDLLETLMCELMRLHRGRAGGFTLYKGVNIYITINTRALYKPSFYTCLDKYITALRKVIHIKFCRKVSREIKKSHEVAYVDSYRRGIKRAGESNRTRAHFEPLEK